MKQLLKIAIAATITTLSINAHAEDSSPFNYIEYSVGIIQYDDYTDPSDGSTYSPDDGDYSSLAISVETPFFALPLLSAERIDFNFFDVTKIGAGSYLQFEANSYAYGLVHYNDYSSDDTDNDFSFTAGARHRFTQRLEGNLSYTEYTDEDSFSGGKVSLNYYLHPNFSISASFQPFDNANIFAAGGRVSF